MLTAAVREWKLALGAGVEIDVRAPCPALWEHNPHLTPLADGAGELIATSCPKWVLWARQPQWGSCASRAGPESDETPKQRWE